MLTLLNYVNSFLIIIYIGVHGAAVLDGVILSAAKNLAFRRLGRSPTSNGA
jgi:hypothetical protein